MKFAEIKDLKRDELLKRRREARENYFGAKMKHSLGQLANPVSLREMRKAIARTETALRIK